MKLEEMEKMLEIQIDQYRGITYISFDGLNSLSNAVQALLMVKQEIDRQKTLEAKYEAENE